MKPTDVKEKIEMSQEELAEFKEFQAERQRKQEEQKKQSDREAYKELVDEAIDAVSPIANSLSHLIGYSKAKIHDTFKDVLKLKEEVFDEKEGQQSHTWTHSKGHIKIRLGYNVTDDYDDTVSAGIEKVHKYITSLAKDEETQALVDAVLRLLQKDSTTGTLKASRVLQLRKMAEGSKNADFMDGVKIIEQAYRPAKSKEYVRMWVKNAYDEFEPVPLGMTEASNKLLDAFGIDLLKEDLEVLLGVKDEDKLM